MNRGTTLKFETDQPYGEDQSGEEFAVNILNGMNDTDPVDYADGVLEAAGYVHVGKRQYQLDIWETPGGMRPLSVYFLFASELPAPIASSANEDALKRLKEALEFAESGMLTYTIKERRAPSSS